MRYDQRRFTGIGKLKCVAYDVFVIYIAEVKNRLGEIDARHLACIGGRVGADRIANQVGIAAAFGHADFLYGIAGSGGRLLSASDQKEQSQAKESRQQKMATREMLSQSESI